MSRHDFNCFHIFVCGDVAREIAESLTCRVVSWRSRFLSEDQSRDVDFVPCVPCLGQFRATCCLRPVFCRFHIVYGLDPCSSFLHLAGLYLDS